MKIANGKKRQIEHTVVRSVTMGYSKKENDASKACKSRGNDLRVHFKVRTPSSSGEEHPAVLRACLLLKNRRLLRLRAQQRAPRAQAGLRRPTLGFRLRGALALTLPLQNTRETAFALKGMKLDKAKSYLEQGLNRDRCIPFHRYCGGVGRTAQAKNENSTTGQGRWPVKSVEFIRDLLRNAESNAEVRVQPHRAAKT